MLLSFLVSLCISYTIVVVAGGATDSLLSALRAADDCASCLGLLGAFQSLAILGDDVFTTSFTDLCIGLGVIFLSLAAHARAQPHSHRRPRTQTSAPV
jgi:hypothetical protein